MKRLIGIFCVLAIIGCFQSSLYAADDVMAKLQSMKPEDFPNNTVEFLVVYKAGGGMDVTARVLAKYAEKYIGTSIAVLNKTGGGGLIGHTYFATQAKNDGYTIGILANSFWSDAISRAEGKWSYKDMEPLQYINHEPRTWVVSTSGRLKDKSLREVVEMAKEAPNTIKVGITPGMQSEFAAEAVEMATGAKFNKVPYQGGRPQIIAVLGGHIDIAAAFLPEFRGHLEEGKVRILANCGDERYVFFPLVPTFKEVLGINYVNQSWRFAAVPKGVPRDRFNFLEAALGAALHDPELIKEFDSMGIKMGVKYMNSKEASTEIERLYVLEKEHLVKTGRISE